MVNVKEQLKNVFWLGGSPCSGKSSISAVLARRFGLDVYHLDEAFDTHIKSLDPENHPALTRWCAASWDQRWMQPQDVLLTEVIACYSEHFSMVLKDILSLPKTNPLLVEGSALLPGEVNGVLAEKRQAVWLIPTADFQREQYAKREWVKGILQKCGEPETAFNNWMERDIQFARWVAAETKSSSFRLLTLDGSQPIEETATMIAAGFGLDAS